MPPTRPLFRRLASTHLRGPCAVPLLGALLFCAALCAVIAAPVAVDVSIRLTGTLQAHTRISGSYSMYVEDWSIRSEFSQAAEYTLVRENLGQVRGAPTMFYRMMGANDANVFEPMISPFDVVNHRLTGEVKVSGCVNRTDALTPRAAPALPPGVTLPPGVSLPKVDQGTFYVESCGASPDQLLVFYLPPPGLYDVPAAGPIRCTQTFSYKRDQRWDSQYEAHLLEAKYVEALNAACPGHPRPRTKWMAFVGSASWSALLRGDTIRLEKQYQASKGPRPLYEHDLNLAVELQAGDTLRAEPGGPYAPARGETVTLDGSRSRPSKGRPIRSYKWKLTPTGCPDLGTTTEMTGPRVTFKALCAVTAELTVDDGAKTDTRAANVTVKERAWKTALTTDPAIDLRSLGFEPGNFAFGMNRCKRHPDPNENHYYQPRAGSMIDYEEGAFWLDRVADGGPFRGVWFVAKGDFAIPRVVIVNQKLYPTGSVYELNAAKSLKQKAEIDRLRHAVERHEQLHSTLLERAVKASDDPAKAVERGMAKDRGALKEQMNSILRDAYTRLTEATAEARVKAEMRKIPEFGPGGRIYYPASGSMREGYRDFPSFAELGDSDTPGGGGPPGESRSVARRLRAPAVATRSPISARSPR